MSESDVQQGAGWLAYWALQGEEPLEFALSYLSSVGERIGWISKSLEGVQLGTEITEELAELRLFFAGLGASANRNQPTPYELSIDRKGHLTLKPRRGRPRRERGKVRKYREAAIAMLKRKPRGPDGRGGYAAAALEVSKETGLDRSEIERWASHLEAASDNLTKYRQRLHKLDWYQGRFWPGEQRQEQVYLAACTAAEAVDAGAALDNLAAQLASQHGLTLLEAREWIVGVAHESRWRELNPYIGK